VSYPRPIGEGRFIGDVVRRVRAVIPDVVVVDDGSPDDTARQAEAAGAVVLRHAANRGKGAALQTGFAHAREAGRTSWSTMDGDGQHDPADLPRFRRGLPSDWRTSVWVGNRYGRRRRPCRRLRRATNALMS